jgi:hypothetical protein
MYTGTLQYLQNIALTGEYAGLQGMSDSSVHNALTVDLGFLPTGTQFLAHYTYGCGNDNLMGKGTTVPEPGTILLLGSGLFGLAFARRRMKK